MALAGVGRTPERLQESLPIIPVMGKTALSVIAPAETAIGSPSTTARRLVNASVSDNTRRAYAGALGQLDAWLDGRRLDDGQPRRLPRRVPLTLPPETVPARTIGFGRSDQEARCQGSARAQNRSSRSSVRPR